MIKVVLFYLNILFATKLYASTLMLDTTRYPHGDFSQAGDDGGVYRSVARSVIPLALAFRLDTTFTAEQKEILKQAARIFVDRALTAPVLDCAYRKGIKDLPTSRENFETQLIVAMTLRHLNGLYYPGFAYIARFFDENNIVGLGFVNLFYDKTKPLPGYEDRHYLHVAINGDFMGSTNQYSYAMKPEYWAGAVAHEFLHNLGYVHPTGYPGSFINEYGNCIWSNGREYKAADDTYNDKVIKKEL